MKRKFKCRIYHISCQNLESKDSNGLSDPFVKFNFDQYKNFKTPVMKKTLNPEYEGFDLAWDYETVYAKAFPQKSLVIIVADEDTLGEDKIGQCIIDLRTLASGPIYYDVQLRNEGKPTGRIKFTFEMYEECIMTSSFEEIKCTNLPLIGSDKPNTIVEVFFTGTGSEEEKTPIITTDNRKENQNPSWEAWTFVRTKSNLRLLYEGCFELKFFHKRTLGANKHFGTVKISPFKYHSFEKKFPLLVSEPIVLNEGFTSEGQCMFECKLSYENFPEFAQLKSGICDGKNITGAVPSVWGLPHPPRIPVSYIDGKGFVTSVSQAVPEQQAPANAAGFFRVKTAAQGPATDQAEASRRISLSQAQTNSSSIASDAAVPTKFSYPPATDQTPVNSQHVPEGKMLGWPMPVQGAPNCAPLPMPGAWPMPGNMPTANANPAWPTPVPGNVPAQSAAMLTPGGWPMPMPGTVAPNANAAYPFPMPGVMPGSYPANAVPSMFDLNQQMMAMQLNPPCVVCARPAMYDCAETKAKVCSRECKMINLQNIAAAKAVAEAKVKAEVEAKAKAEAEATAKAEAEATAKAEAEAKAKAEAEAKAKAKADAEAKTAGLAAAILELPPNWVQAVDPTSGNVFYQNVVLQASSFFVLSFYDTIAPFLNC